MNWFKGKSVVVPIDYSDASIGAVRFAEQIADYVEAIHAIHVIPQINDPYVGYAGSVLDAPFGTQTQQGFETWLDEHRSNAVLTTAVKVGDPGLTIADYASVFENGLIVMPSHGRTGISHVFMGSVAERVVRHAGCPVMILKSVSSKDQKAIVFNKSPVIVPFDFSEEAIAAIEVAKQFISEGRDLHVVHVIPNLSLADSVVNWDAAGDEKRKRDVRDAMQKSLANIVNDDARLDVGIGDPGHVLVDLAKQIDAGLVVISSHGRTGLTRVLLGSVAERVVRHADCPVLVLKSEKIVQRRSAERKQPKSEPQSSSHIDDLLEVYSTDDPNYAEILRNALNTVGIKCKIDGEHQGGFAGLTSFPVKLLVLAEDYDRARKYIETHDPK